MKTKSEYQDYQRPNVALLYVRVSSEEQTHGFSLANQEKACREYCRQNGWETIRVFREEGESAKTTDRTQLKLMQDYCLKNMGKVGYIVVWKVDRFARSTHDHIMLRKFFSDIGIELKSATEVIENTPMGKAAEGMLAIMAQYENDVKTERTLMGMREKARNGYWPVGAPWGYKNVKDSTGKKIIVQDPEKAPVVKYIFQEFARGTIRVSDLAKKVREKWNVRSKRGFKISKQLVYKILRNPIHCGKVVIPKWGVSEKGKHEPIISEAEFDEVQNILNGGKRAHQPKSRDHPGFPLRGVLCDECGRALTGGYSKGRNQMYAYYSCITPSCPHKGSIKKDTLEVAFTHFLESLTPHDGLLEAFAEAVVVVYEHERKEGIAALRKIESQIAKIDEELDEIIQLTIKKVLSQQDYFEQSERRKALKRELEVRREQLSNPEASVEADVRFGLALVKELPMLWRTLEPGELRVLRGLLFPQNLRYDRSVFKTAELPPIYKLKSSSEDDLNRYVTLSGFEPEFRP